MDRDALISCLRRVIATGPPPRLVVLFGSRARGTAREESDADVGIVPVGELSLEAELNLAAALSGASKMEVDLVRLDRADPLLAREAARTGVAVFEARPGEFAAFRANAISEWLDFDETIAPHRARFLARIAGTGGVVR